MLPNGVIPEEKGMNLLLCSKREVELFLKEIDFGKMSDKIVRSMESRLGEILKNNYSFKSYVSSFFRCLYGKELYPNFLAFLTKT